MNLYLNADCMNPETGLPSFPDKHFDLAIVDPPYGIGNRLYHANGRPARDRFNKEMRQNNWDTTPPPEEYFVELFRISKNQIIWGGNYFDLPPTRTIICWDKEVYAPTMSQIEMAWTSFDSPARLIKINNNDINRLHPTQKPMALYRWLIKNYAKQGDLILDTHVGSASSLVVYEEMGFEYVGFELDADYYRESTKRLEAYRKQQTLFSGKEIFEASAPTQQTLF